MLKRCDNPTAINFDRYGGRGITVCEAWRDFNQFAKDMGERPDGASLDRIDNGKSYSPENCRWATAKEQALNRRNNRLIVRDGVARPLSVWCETLGLPYQTVLARIVRLGWSEDRALRA
jgi:hypothetical protein